MSHDKPTPATNTGAPARNFNIATEQQVRAITAGPPAYMRRLRAIEDLEAAIVRELARLCHEARRRGADEKSHAIERAPTRAIERLATLIEGHNRWYPIEANLPLHPRTGELVDRGGVAWQPIKRRALTELLADARAR